MEGVSRKRQHVGTHRTIACSPIVERISRAPPAGIYKNPTSSTSKASTFPHHCMPPLLPTFHHPHCVFTTTCNRELQYHALLFHSTRRFHKCPLCPKRFKHRSGFDFHLSHTHEFNPSVVHHVLSLQEDFYVKRPFIQLLIEDSGHHCLFLLQFHCELN